MARGRESEPGLAGCVAQEDARVVVCWNAGAS